jgi:hypothetical protein
MNRFKLLASVFAALTLVLVYEGALAAVHGIEALLGIGVPRLLMPGVASLGSAILTLALATLTFRLARMQLTIGRAQTKVRGRVA